MNKQDFIKYTHDLLKNGHIDDDYFQYMKDRYQHLMNESLEILRHGDGEQALHFTSNIMGLLASDEMALIKLKNEAKAHHQDFSFSRIKGYIRSNVEPNNEAFVNFKNDYEHGRK